jgi:circadian clock protein KaiC
MYHPSETEMGDTLRRIQKAVTQAEPSRVVIDSLSEFRLLAQNPHRYRRQVLALKQFFAGRRCTVILLDDSSDSSLDFQVRSIAHGVLILQHLAPEFAADRRRLRVLKMRGRPFRGGYHDYIIDTGGLVVYPRLIAAEHKSTYSAERIVSGVENLDRLLGGGLDRGTSTLVTGAAGTGKSTLVMQYVSAAAARGEASAVFAFDESRATLVERSEALGMKLKEHLDSGRISIQRVDPAELAPGQLVYAIRARVEQGNCRIIVIDSLNGYLNAMPEERFLTIQMHELLMYLAQQGVTTLLVAAQQGLVGAAVETPVEVSYLADCVILTRYFELDGRVKKAISVVKKRSGPHEDTIRELTIGRSGVQLGEPLQQLQGVLTGTPTFVGTTRRAARSAGTTPAGSDGRKGTKRPRP